MRIGLTRYKNRGFNCERFLRIDSRESRCESPVPLRSWIALPHLSCLALITGRPRFGSVRLRFRDGTVQAVPVFGSGGSSAKRAFSVFQYSLTGKDGSGSFFGSFSGSWKRFRRFRFRFSGKTVPTVPVPGSGSVPEPLCELAA